MPHINLVCLDCGDSYDADMSTLRCRRCGSPLDVSYVDSNAHTMKWVGIDMPLPFHSSRLLATMGEGNTPVVRLKSVAAELALSTVLAKLESMNPTGSFKDRGAAMLMSVAVELGISEIVEDSSGNAGAAVAAYAARTGIRAHVFAPSSAPEAKMGQIHVYGAETHAVPGPRERSTEAAVAFHRERGIVYASHNLSPYFAEGTKTFAYEVAAGMSPAPDHIVIPVGNGGLLLGVHRGYAELLARGSVERMPKLHAIQSEAVMPIAAEFEDRKWTPGGSTVAGGISVADPPRKTQVIRAIRESGGTSLAVKDESIVRWQRFLAESEGVFAEPTSAAAFAGLERLVERGDVAQDDIVLVAVTGFGLKDAVP